MHQDYFFHVAFEPTTGVWSMIMNLASEQKKHGVNTVCVLYYSNKDYFEEYSRREDLQGHSVKWIFVRKWIDSTISLLFNHELTNIIDDFCDKDGSYAYITFHDAHFSSAFLPIKSKHVKRMCTIIHGCPYGLLYQKKWYKRLMHRFFAWRLKKSSLECVAVSREDVNLFQPVTKIPLDRFHVIYNGTSTHKQQSLVTDNKFVVGFIGFLEERKDPRLAIESVKIANKFNGKISLLIAGFGDLVEYVRNEATKHPGIVEYIGSINDPIKNFYPKIDLLLLTSKLEGLPMTILEAFSLGIPVVSTSAGGIKEIVLNGVNGYMVTSEKEDISDRIVQLSNDQKLLEKLGEGAYDFFVSHLSINKCASDYIKLLKDGKI